MTFKKAVAVLLKMIFRVFSFSSVFSKKNAIRSGSETTTKSNSPEQGRRQGGQGDCPLPPIDMLDLPINKLILLKTTALVLNFKLCPPPPPPADKRLATLSRLLCRRLWRDDFFFCFSFDFGLGRKMDGFKLRAPFQIPGHAPASW